MSIDNEEPGDALAEHCWREHSYRPDPDCASCSIRSELVHCGPCGASFEDGRWWTALGSTAPNGCDHEALVDDWDCEITCQTPTGEHPLTGAKWGRCGDAVETPANRHCDFHQRILDAEECARIYQRLVACRSVA